MKREIDSWEKAAFLKLAGPGSICFLPLANGKYLMQRNGPQDYNPGKLRPPGGGESRADHGLYATIVRELQEEFKLSPEDVKNKIEFLGYTYQKKFWGTTVFELKNHGLKPGKYQASNDPDETVVLEECSLDDEDYVGPMPYRLITEEAKDRGDDLMKSARLFMESELRANGADDLETYRKNSREAAATVKEKNGGHGRVYGSCDHLISQCRCSHKDIPDEHLSCPCEACWKDQHEKSAAYTIQEKLRRQKIRRGEIPDPDYPERPIIVKPVDHNEVDEVDSHIAKEAGVVAPAPVPTTGPEAIAYALNNIDLDKEEADAHAIVAKKLKSKRPDAIKKLGYIDGFRRSGLHPRDLMINRVPVIPPQFRPYTVSGDVFIPGDANELYRDLINIVGVHKELAGKFGSAGVAPNKLRVYDAARAVYGFGDPVAPKTKERGVSGFLQKLVGSSPKFSFSQRKLFSKDLDFVGRSVIGVDPDLTIDEIGLPEEMAWKLYAPHVQRRLVRAGMSGSEAVRAIRDRNEHARAALFNEADERPVMYSRAPSWHKFNVLGGKPKIIPGNTIMINPLVTTGAGADFDGDQMNVHVPALDDAVQDVKNKLMPSKMLFSIKNPEQIANPLKQELILGLYSAQQRPSNRPPIMFPDHQTALAAVRAGKVRMNDDIQIQPPTPVSPPVV